MLNRFLVVVMMFGVAAVFYDIGYFRGSNFQIAATPTFLFTSPMPPDPYAPPNWQRFGPIWFDDRTHDVIVEGLYADEFTIRANCPATNPGVTVPLDPGVRTVVLQEPLRKYYITAPRGGLAADFLEVQAAGRIEALIAARFTVWTEAEWRAR